MITIINLFFVFLTMYVVATMGVSVALFVIEIVKRKMYKHKTIFRIRINTSEPIQFIVEMNYDYPHYRFWKNIGCISFVKGFYKSSYVNYNSATEALRLFTSENGYEKPDLLNN